MTTAVSSMRTAPLERWVRLAVALGVVVGLSSAPYTALTRWVSRGVLELDTWPYVVSYWLPAIAGAALFVWDVVVTRFRAAEWPRPVIAAIAAPLALAAWALCSITWSDSPDRTPRQALLMALVVLTSLWFGLALKRVEQLAALFVGTHLLTAMSVLASIGLQSARFAEDDTWMGVFNNPNSLSPIAALGVLAAVAVWRIQPEPAWRAVVVIALIVDAVVLVKASSATGWIAALAGIAALFVVTGAGRLRERGTQLRGVQVAGAGILAGFVLLSPWLLRWIADLFGKDATLSGRTVIWEYVFEASAERRWTGFGFASFWDTPVNRQLLGERRTFSTIPDAAHSTFMETLLYLGVIGLALVLVAVAVSVGLAWWRALAGIDWWVGWWAALASVALVENITESMIAYHSILWMLLLASGCSAVSGRHALDD